MIAYLTALFDRSSYVVEYNRVVNDNGCVEPYCIVLFWQLPGETEEK
jgi:hypothetical protein